MKLVSVNVGLPREITWHDKIITSGIFKEPIATPITLRVFNLDGDKQADLSVHGGVNKAVYAYPSEHYAYWRTQLPGTDLPWGVFGENFTTEGLDEEQTKVGDRFRVGEAEVVVTQPRLPCYKLGVRFGRIDMPKKFLASRRTGFYLAVLRSGLVERDSTMELISRDEQAVSVADVTRIYAFEKDDIDTLRRATRSEALPESWKDYFLDQIRKRGPAKQSAADSRSPSNDTRTGND